MIITEIILKARERASARFCYEQSVELASVFDSASDNANTDSVPPEVDFFGAATAAPLESVDGNTPSPTGASTTAAPTTAGAPSQLHGAAGALLLLMLSAVASLLL